MLDIFYPHRCPICDDVLPVGIDCTACVKCERIVQKAVRPYCMKCGKPIGDERKEFCTDCEKREHFYLQGKAAFVYDKYMQKNKKPVLPNVIKLRDDEPSGYYCLDGIFI